MTNPLDDLARIVRSQSSYSLHGRHYPLKHESKNGKKFNCWVIIGIAVGCLILLSVILIIFSNTSSLKTGEQKQVDSQQWLVIVKSQYGDNFTFGVTKTNRLYWVSEKKPIRNGDRWEFTATNGEFITLPTEQVDTYAPLTEDVKKRMNAAGLVLKNGSFIR